MGGDYRRVNTAGIELGFKVLYMMPKIASDSEKAVAAGDKTAAQNYSKCRLMSRLSGRERTELAAQGSPLLQMMGRSGLWLEGVLVDLLLRASGAMAQRGASRCLLLHVRRHSRGNSAEPWLLLSPMSLHWLQGMPNWMPLGLVSNLRVFCCSSVHLIGICFAGYIGTTQNT